MTTTRKPKTKWTPEMDAMLEELAGTMTSRKISERICVPMESVRNRAYALGIKLQLLGELNANAKYPDSDVRLVRQLNEAGMKPKLIAEKMEVNVHTVYKWINNKARVDRSEEAA